MPIHPSAAARAAGAGLATRDSEKKGEACGVREKRREVEPLRSRKPRTRRRGTTSRTPYVPKPARAASLATAPTPFLPRRVSVRVSVRALGERHQTPSSLPVADPAVEPANHRCLSRAFVPVFFLQNPNAAGVVTASGDCPACSPSSRRPQGSRLWLCLCRVPFAPC